MPALCQFRSIRSCHTAPRMTADTGPGRAVLNLGSGRKRLPDAINVDRTAATAPDVVHDLDVRPWPFEDNRFDEVLAFDVIEHLDNVVSVMEEVHRICRDGARIEITVPHFSSGNAFTDPTHRHFFSRYSFHYFEGSHEFGFYSEARFEVRRANLIFTPGLVNRLVSRLANRYPRAYERRWAWMFPAWFVSFELRVQKP
jgi:SAM-dependent methyltransferase